MPRQRIFGVFVQPAYSLAVESLFFDLEMRTNEEFWRQFLDRESDCVRRLIEAPIPHGSIAFAAARWEQLRRGIIVECSAVL